MKKCPKCGSISAKFKYAGWVVQATGTVWFNDEGVVEQVGPAVACSVIKPGQELKSPNLLITCPKCGHQGVVKSFQDTLPSYISGQEATSVVQFGLIEVHVTESERSIVARWIHNPAYSFERDSTSRISAAMEGIM